MNSRGHLGRCRWSVDRFDAPLLSHRTSRPLLGKTVGAGAFSQLAPGWWRGGVSSMERLRIRCQQHLCGGMARQSAFMLIAPGARRAEIGVFVAHGRPPWLCRRGTLHPPAAMPQPDPSPQLVASTFRLKPAAAVTPNGLANCSMPGNTDSVLILMVDSRKSLRFIIKVQSSEFRVQSSKFIELGAVRRASASLR